MKFNLGEIRCVYCNSLNLEFCDWYPDERHENIDDINFMNEVEKHIQDNFSDFPEQEYLFHCKDCNKWFTFKTNAKKLGFSLLPFSKAGEIISDCFLILDPIELHPQSIQINNIRLSVLSYVHIIPSPKFSSNMFSPYYPYPHGTYDLVCTLDDSNNHSFSFELQISKKYEPIIQLENKIDLDFFRFSIDWYSFEGEEIIKHIQNINDSIDKINFDPEAFVDEAINNNLISFSSMPEEASTNISIVASTLRNKQAYRFLNWLENELRKFVWAEYKNIYSNQINSSKWWKGCFPKEVINKIKDNQNNDLKIGQKIDSRFPLAYADFDNLLILLDKEWKSINKKLNKDFDIIKGHFKYMKHFRNSIAHSRYLSHIDLMELQSNALKFLSLIGIDKFSCNNCIFYKNMGKKL